MSGVSLEQRDNNVDSDTRKLSVLSAVAGLSRRKYDTTPLYDATR